MHECDKFRSYFSDFIESELTPELHRQVETHLKICTDCSETVYQLRIIRESLRKMPRVTTSPDFDLRLHQQIANLNSPGKYRVPVFLHNWKVPAVGSALLLATVGFFMVYNSHNSSSALDPTVQSSGLTPARNKIFNSAPNPNQQLKGQNQLGVPGIVHDTVANDSGNVDKNAVRLVGEQ